MKKIIVMAFCLLLSKSALASSVYVEQDWLKSRLGSKDIVLVDMTTDGVQYLRFHIPGAVRLSYQDINLRRKDKVSVRVPDERLYKVLGGIGISRDSHVVIYDDMGGLDAGRLFWELERIGHPKVSVLRGGLVSWVLAGNKVDNIPVKPKPAVYKAGEGGRDNEATLSLVRGNEKAVLLDVRSEEEYLGHPRYPRSGHIPGARWWPWENNVDFERGFVPKPRSNLEQALATVGVKDRDQPLVVYCRSGHRASQSYLTLRDLGYTNVRLYDGSMAEYSQQRDLPVQKGK